MLLLHHNMQIKIPHIIRKTNPRWTKKLEERETWVEIRKGCVVDGKVLNIARFECCIVGEALNILDKPYNWNSEVDNYDLYFNGGCQTCLDTSLRLNEIINGLDDDSNLDNFERRLEDFANHLEEKHQNLIPE